jgi:DNA (cytosine-5)-methyltransferase 1
MADIDKDSIKDITILISEFKEKHGCQIILNGITPTLKYYLRLISSLGEFITIYSNLIETDNEIKIGHKKRWNNLLSKHFK